MLLYNAQEPTDFESYQERGDIGFTDVAGAQIDTFMYEDLSNSRGRNLDAELLKEVHKVNGLAPEMFGPKSVPKTNPNAPKILQDAWNETAQGQDALRLSDWESMVEPNLEALKERFPDANIRNRDEIDTDIASQAKAYRDEFEEVYSYADPYAGFFGTLGGAAVASMADPINIMTLPLGAGRVAGASFIKGLGIVAARSFGIGVATETALQPFVYDYKKEIESPYDLQDALFNMAAAGIGEGLLNGLGHSIGKGFTKLTGKQELPDTYENRQLRKDIQTLLELQTFADETGAKTVGELEIHLNALNTAMADIKAGRKVDYDALGETIERQYVEGFDSAVDGARKTMDFIAQERYRLEQSYDAELHSKQEQLQQFGEQKLSPLELKQAKAKADAKIDGELNQETDLGKVREIQKNEWDKSVGEDTVRLNDEANKANNELRASRRDEGDMLALKKQLDDLDKQYTDEVEYHSAAKRAREQYIADKTEETSQAIKIAPTDTPRMTAVKTAVNRIAASMGANDIKVKVYEGNPELDGDLRYSLADGVAPKDRMITVHNIGPEAVIHADELGGLPAPSIAVIKASVGLDNFGDITLVAHPDMIDPKKSRKNRIFNADVYSPRYPNISYKVNRRLFESLTKELDDVAEKNGFPYAVTQSGVESSGLKEFTESWLVAYRYLETIGEAPEIKTKDDGQVVIYGVRNEVWELMTDERHAGFSKWIKDSFSEMITSEKIFTGYGADGSRKYKAHTLNNVVKHMTKDLRGGEDWKGPGQLRAYAAKEFKSISDIQSSRDSLVDEETMLDIKGDINLRVEDLANELKPFYKFDSSSFGFMDEAIENLQEFVQTGRLQDFTELPADILKSVDALVSDLRELPSSYFEAKIQRSVGFDEFKVALVPSEANFNEAAKVLARNGVKVIRHASSDSKAKALNSLDELMFSKQGNTIEAAINPETGELHINASAFRDEAHLMEVMREEIIGHYGLRRSLGDDFQGVIDDIKSTALTNPELRQMWIDLSGIDPQTKQIINPNAPYKGMADDVIADEIISKMARDEISDTTWMALKNIIIKALRKIGLIKDDITISEMKALVMKSEKALKKNVVKQPRITGLKPQLKQVDEPLNIEAINAEAARIVSDETTDQVIFDQNGNTINLRDSLMEDDNDIAAIESVKVCML